MKLSSNESTGRHIQIFVMKIVAYESIILQQKKKTYIFMTRICVCVHCTSAATRADSSVKLHIDSCHSFEHIFFITPFQNDVIKKIDVLILCVKILLLSTNLIIGILLLKEAFLNLFSILIVHSFSF